MEHELDRGLYWTWKRLSLPEKRTLWNEIRRLLDFAVLGRFNRDEPSAAAFCTSRNQVLGLFSGRYTAADFKEVPIEVSVHKDDVLGRPLIPPRLVQGPCALRQRSWRRIRRASGAVSPLHTGDLTTRWHCWGKSRGRTRRGNYFINDPQRRFPRGPCFVGYSSCLWRFAIMASTPERHQSPRGPCSDFSDHPDLVGASLRVAIKTSSPKIEASCRMFPS